MNAIRFTTTLGLTLVWTVGLGAGATVRSVAGPAEPVAALPPAIPGISRAGTNDVALGWDSGSGTRYNLQWSPTLEPGQWRSLSGLITGDGTRMSVLDAASESQRFYRIITIGETIQRSEPDTGTAVQLTLPTLLEITLDANPSTGFRWEVVPGSERVVRQLGAETFVPSEGALGSGGKTTFRFETVSPGQTQLTLIYRRSFSTGDPAQTFQLDVTVSP